MDGERRAVRPVAEGLGHAVDALAELDASALDDGEVDLLLATLTRAANRLAGEVARIAAQSEESGVWVRAGAASMPSHLATITGSGYGVARASVELGRAMAAVPALARAMRGGELSPGAARAVAGAINDELAGVDSATDGCDAEERRTPFVDVAPDVIVEMPGMTPAEARRHVEAWRHAIDPPNDAVRRQRAVDRRHLRFVPQGDGTTYVDGVVPDHVASGLRRTLKHLADAQRLDESGRTNAQRRVDALGDLVAAFERGEVTGGRNLPRLVVTASLEDLESRGQGLDADGEVVPASQIERLCCDSVIHRYVFDQRGAVLSFGRGRRTASPNQFLALSVRDGGCRHPGCDRPVSWCEAHHLREFAARGGLTDVDEMVLLCHHHHHALHDDGWTLAGTPEHLEFVGPDGRRLRSTLDLPRPVTTNVAA